MEITEPCESRGRAARMAFPSAVKRPSRTSRCAVPCTRDSGGVRTLRTLLVPGPVARSRIALRPERTVMNFPWPRRGDRHPDFGSDEDDRWARSGLRAQVSIRAPGGVAAFGDGPHHQRLTAPHVARREDPADI